MQDTADLYPIPLVLRDGRLCDIPSLDALKQLGMNEEGKTHNFLVLGKIPGVNSNLKSGAHKDHACGIRHAHDVVWLQNLQDNRVLFVYGYADDFSQSVGMKSAEEKKRFQVLIRQGSSASKYYTDPATGTKIWKRLTRPSDWRQQILALHPQAVAEAAAEAEAAAAEAAVKAAAEAEAEAAAKAEAEAAAAAAETEAAAAAVDEGSEYWNGDADDEEPAASSRSPSREELREELRKYEEMKEELRKLKIELASTKRTAADGAAQAAARIQAFETEWLAQAERLAETREKQNLIAASISARARANPSKPFSFLHWNGKMVWALPTRGPEKTASENFSPFLQQKTARDLQGLRAHLAGGVEHAAHVVRADARIHRDLYDEAGVTKHLTTEQLAAILGELNGTLGKQVSSAVAGRYCARVIGRSERGRGRNPQGVRRAAPLRALTFSTHLECTHSTMSVRHLECLEKLNLRFSAPPRPTHTGDSCAEGVRDWMFVV